MFSNHYERLCSATRPREVWPAAAALAYAAEAAPGDPGFARLLFAEGFGAGGELDCIILRRAEETKSALFHNRVQAVVPIYVTSICSEHCRYCNYRAGNKDVAIRRARLSDAQLAAEAEFLVNEKGLHSLELVYASDPFVRADDICRHAETLRNVLERHGGGLVGLSAEPLEQSEYRRLRDAGVSFSVLWQETYHQERYRELHPGKGKKPDFRYRMDAFERMLAAGIPDVGIGILTGLAPWKEDWAMLFEHERYLVETVGQTANILGLPRLKPAPGAEIQSTPFIPTDREFITLIALHNLRYPRVRPFVTTRETFAIGAQLARGGGCLFTYNCTTIPGGYTMGRDGYQFPSGNYDAPIFSRKLEEMGLATDWMWAPPTPTPV